MNLKSPEQQDRRQAALERFSDVWRKTREESKILKQQIEELLPRITLLADGDSIKNQQIDVINEGDRVVVTFKLVKEKWEELAKRFRDDPSVEKKPIIYSGAKRDYKMCDGLRLSIGNFDIHVADDNDNIVRSSHGLVRIEIGSRRKSIEKDDPEHDDYSFGLAGDMVKMPSVLANDVSMNEYSWQSKMYVFYYQHGIKVIKCEESWPPASFQTDKYSQDILGGMTTTRYGMITLPQDMQKRPIVWIRSRLSGDTFCLFLDDPQTQEDLGMKEEGVSVSQETITAPDGDQIVVEKGINYFLADLSALYLASEKGSLGYKVAGYNRESSGRLHIVLVGKDIKVLSYRQFLQFSAVLHEEDSKIKKISEEQLALELEEVMEKIFDIKDALLSPDANAERMYKIKRYCWAHNFPEDRKLTVAEEKSIALLLERKEVAPGYFTFVEHGRAKKMEGAAPFFLYHGCDSIKNIPKMIDSNSLICSHERFRRGLKLDGMSSDDDLRGGGGDGVFLRMWADKVRVQYDTNYYGTFLVFDNFILDRTDYYCYRTDEYGKTDPAVFKSRLTAEELLNHQIEFGFRDSNEVVFRHGISFEDVKFIVVKDKDRREAVLGELYAAGITEVNGKLVGDFVIIKSEYSSVAEVLSLNFDEKQSKAKDRVKILQNESKKLRIGPGQYVVVTQPGDVLPSGEVGISMRQVKIGAVNKDSTLTLEGPDSEIVKLEDVVLSFPLINAGDTVRSTDRSDDSGRVAVVLGIYRNSRGALIAYTKGDGDLGEDSEEEVINLELASPGSVTLPTKPSWDDYHPHQSDYFDDSDLYDPVDDYHMEYPDLDDDFPDIEPLESEPNFENVVAPKFKPGNTVINLAYGKYPFIAKGEKGLVVNYHKMLKPEDDLVDVKVEGTLYKVLAKDFDISTPDKVEVENFTASSTIPKSLGASILKELGPEED
ncbi:MAG: hypothetical protein HY225_03620 [Candidatus Vogelbacteria bacterium]|nr:hypothetical protein [Candidatus Vogelbacteria bacterium]